MTLAPGAKVPEDIEARLRSEEGRHNPWDGACSKHIMGEPTMPDARCPICRPDDAS